MTPDHLATLHAQCFPDRPWQADEFVDLLARNDTHLIETSHGFLVISCLPPEAEILTVAVDPLRRRQGEGRHLLQKLEHVCAGLDVDEIFLEVADDNTAARALYDSLEFAEVGRRQQYYARHDGSHVDALVMRKALTAG